MSRRAGRARPTGTSPTPSRPCAASPSSTASSWPRAAGTTRWSSALPPQKGDIKVAKPRYSAFFNTQLDSLLRARGIRSLVFTGVATNVCVESTLRDSFHLEYFSVVLHDATHHAGPAFIQEATLYNVEKFFGWVSSVEEFRNALAANINPMLTKEKP